MMKIYNPKDKRLEFYQQEATADFWDDHWNTQWQGNTEELAQKVIYRKDSLIEGIVNRYLPGKNARILEAGCGLGKFVYLLTALGYTNTYGVDYASQTVALLNKSFPALKISPQDVQQTNFPDHFFDFYLSLGVIEHFYGGYEKIIREAKRIVKLGGYLAISFPQMSPLRKLKARLGFYPAGTPSPTDHFYQFAFDPLLVVENLKKEGLVLQEMIFYDGLKGLKDEVALSRPLLRRLYNYRGPSRFWRRCKNRLDRYLKPSTAHMAMLVLKNVHP